MSDLSEKMKGLVDGLKVSIGEQLFKLLMSQLLTTENILWAMNYILDEAEKLAAKTETKLDDEIIKKVRDALNIPKK